LEIEQLEQPLLFLETTDIKGELLVVSLWDISMIKAHLQGGLDPDGNMGTIERTSTILLRNGDKVWCSEEPGQLWSRIQELLKAIGPPMLHLRMIEDE
jgi:hypothetical protein